MYDDEYTDILIFVSIPLNIYSIFNHAGRYNGRISEGAYTDASFKQQTLLSENK